MFRKAGMKLVAISTNALATEAFSEALIATRSGLRAHVSLAAVSQLQSNQRGKLQNNNALVGNRVLSQQKVVTSAIKNQFVLSRFFSSSASRDGDIDITGIDKAALLAAIYNNAQPQGFGSVNPNRFKELTYERAEKIIAAGIFDYDYINGRVLKINIKGDSVSPHLYDRDNGDNAVASIVEECRKNIQFKPKSGG